MQTERTVDVLVVDDDVDIVDSLRDALSDEGLRVAVARDGQEALEYLDAEPAPALILLDWMMPRCDGYTFRERQRANSRIASIPVVVLTADTRVETKERASDAAAVLHKPVRFEDLLTLIRRLAGGPASIP